MTSPHQQKLRISGPVIITANRLSDGAVVHRTKNGEWTERLDLAEVLTTADAALAALQAANGDQLHAVGAYAAAVDNAQGAIKPGNLRETIRGSGPTFALPADTPHSSVFDLASRRAAQRKSGAARDLNAFPAKVAIG